MQKLSGLTVNPGVAYGKAYLLQDLDDIRLAPSSPLDQMEVLSKALLESSSRLEEQIRSAHMLYSDRISIIFEAQKLMMNDSMIIDRAKTLILENHLSAYDAYKKSTSETIELFQNHPIEYLRNRIVDIEDATDRVLATILDKEYEFQCQFDEPRILVMKKMKPSIMINCDKKNILGFIAQEGAYNQHSGMIARTKDIPGLIVNEIFECIQDYDMLLINANLGEVYINPDVKFVNQLLEERR